MKPINVINKINEGVDWDYYDRFHELNEKYLPSQGEGETEATQAITAINKLVYKWYNDGDVYDNVNSGLEGWANDLSSYANWLHKNIDGASEILERIFELRYGDTDKYEVLLQDLSNLIYDENYLEGLNSQPKTGSIYDCDGPFEFNEGGNDEWEDEEDYYEDEEEDEDYE